MWILLPKAPASKPPCYFSTKPLSAGGQPAQRCLKAQEEKTAASITQWGQRSPSHVPTALGVTSIHQMGLVCSPQQHCSTSPEEAVVEQEDASQQDQGGKRGSQAHVPTEPQEHKLLQRHRCICTFSQAPDISRNSAKNLTAVGAHLWGQIESKAHCSGDALFQSCSMVQPSPDLSQVPSPGCRCPCWWHQRRAVPGWVMPDAQVHTLPDPDGIPHHDESLFAEAIKPLSRLRALQRTLMDIYSPLSHYQPCLNQLYLAKTFKIASFILKDCGYK